MNERVAVGEEDGSEDADAPILEARDVVVERDGTAVLDGVSLSVPAGARLLVRGESGSGKTTLFHVLGLLEPPTAGTLLVEGTDAARLSERRRARLRREAVGVVFQDFQLVSDLTARENAALPQEHAGERDEAWLDELFDSLGIADLAGQYPATLSGGERQRVAIARALANRPTVVLADEPTGQLDPDTSESVLELLLGLQADTGTALVVVSHDPALGERFPEIYRLADGTLSQA
jgi:putative ABC transport system ATP-binding protein